LQRQTRRVEHVRLKNPDLKVDAENKRQHSPRRTVVNCTRGDGGTHSFIDSQKFFNHAAPAEALHRSLTGRIAEIPA
jgi:hypothetical protein